MDVEVGVLDRQREAEPRPGDRAPQRGRHVQVQDIPELVRLRAGFRLHPGGEALSVMRSQSGLTVGAEQRAERAVSQEVEALARKLELHRTGGGLADAARPRHRPRLVGGSWRPIDVQVALVDQPLNDVVQKTRDSVQGLRIGLALAAQRLEHLGRELAALDQGPEDRVLQGVQAVRFLRLAGVRVPAPAPEARVEQEVGEPIEELLDVQGVDEATTVLFVGDGSHGFFSTVAACLPRTAIGMLRRSRHPNAAREPRHGAPSRLPD